MRHHLLLSWGLLCLCGWPASGQVLLKDKVIERTKYSYEISQFATTENGKDRQQVDVGLVVQVDNGMRDGQKQLRQAVKFESLRAIYDFQSPLGNQTLSFDSATNLAKVEPVGDENHGLGFLLDVCKALLGSSYTVVFDNGNHVSSIEGVAEILNKSTPKAAKWLSGRSGQLNLERLKVTHEHLLNRFPEHLLHSGDAWEHDGNVEGYLLGSAFNVKRRYEYLGTQQRGERLVDKIRWTETEFLDKRKPAIIESKGSLYFDRQRGVEVESTHFLHLRYTQRPDRFSELKIETSKRLKEKE